MRTRSTCSESKIELDEEKVLSKQNSKEDEKFPAKVDAKLKEMLPDDSSAKSIESDVNNNEICPDKALDTKNMEATEESPVTIEEKESSDGGEIEIDNNGNTGKSKNYDDSDNDVDAEKDQTDKQERKEHSPPQENNEKGEDISKEKSNGNQDPSTNSNVADHPAYREGLPPFVPDPSSLLSGQMQTSFAKSLSAQFYNSLSMLASKAMMNVKQEPRESGSFRRSSDDATAANSSTKLQVPPRAESRSSDGSTHSYDGQYRNAGNISHHSASPAPSPGSEIVLQRPPSGMSPKSLAEQLRNNDSASMVVSRHQKYSAKNQGYMRSTPYPFSGGESPPPPIFPTLSAFQDPYPTMAELPVVANSNMTPSPSLHHFTTRYTVETPADPSRLGVELVLEHDNEEPIIEVDCGGNRGLLYVNKLCQGSKGQSIHFNDEWLTPNEFQFISGRETAKDWKRSIRHCGKSLKTLMTKGVLQVHPPVCECSHCRGQQNSSGSKLIISGKKPQQQSSSQRDVNNKKLEKSPSFGATDSDHSAPDAMTRHGFDGGLNSIISQLRKANGFDATESSETLDLSKKSNQKNGSISPSSDSRKRPRNDTSPDLTQRNVGDIENGRSSPVPKRPHSRHDDYRHNNFDPPSFAGSYPFLSPEEQYRRMLELVKRSMSPSEQQRQLFNMAQTFSDPLALSRTGFGDFHALPSSLHHDFFSDRKSKFKDNGNLHDQSRKSLKRMCETPTRGSSTTSHREKYRKPDRHTPTPSSHRSDQKYSHVDQYSSSARSDPRYWPANKHSNMIDLNLSSPHVNRMPDWMPKMSSWSAERNEQSTKKHSDIKTMSPRKNGSSRSYFQDSSILDRVPISKTPVTTLHHRPPSTFSGDDDTHQTENRHKHHHVDNRKENRGRHTAHEGGSKNTPMLDLQKHPVPMLSLKRPTEDDLFASADNVGKRLSNSSDQEMKEYNGEDRTRQSSSAPPPRLSPQQNEHSRKSSFGKFSHNRQTSPTFNQLTQYDNYMKRRNDEIEKSLCKMRKMSPEDVTGFVSKIDESIEEHVEEFKKHGIDGEGLPFVTERHLMDIMNIKLGLALKIVARIKRELKILPESVTCCHHSLLRQNVNSFEIATAKTNENIDCRNASDKNAKMNDACDETEIASDNSAEDA